MGPSWYLMPEEHDAWFTHFGFNRKDFYEIKRVDPSYKIFFHDDILEIPADKKAVIELCNTIEPGSGKRVQNLLYEAARNYALLMNTIIRKNTHTMRSKLHVLRTGLKHVGIRAMFQSYHSKIKHVVTDHRLQKILEYPAVFLGGVPSQLPSVYTMLNHVDITLGTWYPVGGFSCVTDAMAKVVRLLGGRIITNAEVHAFEWQNDKTIAGVSTNSKTYDADIIVANADRHFVDQLLLPQINRDFTSKKWNSFPISHGVCSIYLGIKNKLSNFATHTFFFDSSWQQHLADLRDKQLPAHPMFYTHCPAKVDPSAAPKDCNALFALIPIPAGVIDSKNARAAMIANVLERLTPYVDEGKLLECIEVERIMSIQDFESDYNAFQGNAFGMSMVLSQSSIFRLQNKAKRVRNLYYAGQYTTPGTGTTMAMISGELTSSRIVSDYKCTT